MPYFWNLLSLHVAVSYSLLFSSSGLEISVAMNLSLALTYCSSLSFPKGNVHTVYCPLLDPVAKPTEQSLRLTNTIPHLEILKSEKALSTYIIDSSTGII